jgi:hypothetical protein
MTRPINPPSQETKRKPQWTTCKIFAARLRAATASPILYSRLMLNGMVRISGMRIEMMDEKPWE